jgi:hypothetical protein
VSGKLPFSAPQGESSVAGVTVLIAMKRLQPFARVLNLRAGRRAPRSSALVSSGAIMAGIAVVVGMTGLRAIRPGESNPDGGARSQAAGAVATASAFSGITLPDLLVVLPAGLTGPELSRLRAIRGVRKLISFDGAEITVAGRQASVIGVNPGQFRSWVPLGTASYQSLWARLAAGDFIADTTAASAFKLTPAAKYRLTGRSAVRVVFGGSAQLGIAGVDVVVNETLSGRLGLVHEVAALISAPGPSMTSLMTSVRQILGRGVRLVSLRGAGKLAASPASSLAVARHISNYIQLFQQSSAKYCPSLSWTVLAAIGQIESGDGANVGPSSAGALGPMQFLPSTWAQWGIDGFGPKGKPDVMNPFDAVPSAARYLCAVGASSGTSAGLRRAIFAYNHADWYVNEVLTLAAEYAAEYR